MASKYPDWKFPPSFPAVDWTAVVTSDAASGNFAYTPRSIFVGGAGTVVAVSETGNSVSFTAVAGSVLPISPIRIATASTATAMVALY